MLSYLSPFRKSKQREPEPEPESESESEENEQDDEQQEEGQFALHGQALAHVGDATFNEHEVSTSMQSNMTRKLTTPNSNAHLPPRHHTARACTPVYPRYRHPTQCPISPRKLPRLASLATSRLHLWGFSPRDKLHHLHGADPSLNLRELHTHHQLDELPRSWLASSVRRPTAATSL